MKKNSAEKKLCFKRQEMRTIGVLYLKKNQGGIISSHHSTGMTGGCREWKKGPTLA